MECVIALTDKLGVDGLIPLALYESLCELSGDEVDSSFSKGGSQSVEDVINFSEADVLLQEVSEGSENKQKEASSVEEQKERDSDSVNDVCSDAFKLKREQKECPSLEDVRGLLKNNKGNFVLIEGILYHRDKVLGEPVTQLVLPRCRIKKVMELAHESVFGGHMGVRKTKERIRFSFFWPNMTSDISDFVQSCMGCQLRRNDRVSDRAPITPVTRPDNPFEVVNVDLIGPIEPPSSRGHKYILCLVDQMSR